jgi:hypothetical protein
MNCFLVYPKPRIPIEELNTAAVLFETRFLPFNTILNKIDVTNKGIQDLFNINEIAMFRIMSETKPETLSNELHAVAWIIYKTEKPSSIRITNLVHNKLHKVKLSRAKKDQFIYFFKGNINKSKTDGIYIPSFIAPELFEKNVLDF